MIYCITARNAQNSPPPGNSWVYAYVQTQQIVHIKSVQRFVYQLYLNKAVKQKKMKTKTSWVKPETDSGNSNNFQKYLRSWGRKTA